MTVPVEEVAQQVMLWCVTGALGALSGWAVSTLRRQRGEDEAMRQGMRSLLRGEIVRTHHEGVRDGHVTTGDKDVMERTYDAYHALGGNGVATRYHDEYMSLPTVEG